jgi:hypothetical protein
MIDIYIVRSWWLPRMPIVSDSKTSKVRDLIPLRVPLYLCIFELTASHEPGCGGSIDNERHCWGLPRLEINGINMEFNK